MRIFTGQFFERVDDRESAAVFSNMTFRHCHFKSCMVSMTKSPALRTVIQNVTLHECQERGCSIGKAIVEDVLVDGFETAGLFQTFGAVFSRLVLRGMIGRLMISNDVLPDLSVNRQFQYEIVDQFRSANAEYYKHVDWALDISEGEFKELDIRGIPTKLIRRDPETQVVVTRQKAFEACWDEINLKETLWRTSISNFLQREEESIVLVAPKRHQRFRNLLGDLQVLRKAGVVESD